MTSMNNLSFVFTFFFQILCLVDAKFDLKKMKERYLLLNAKPLACLIYNFARSILMLDKIYNWNFEDC